MYLATLLLMITAFIVKGAVVLDSDLGWHLRMGEIIMKTGIPATDPLSYTMPSYPFVDHEWLLNVILFTAYPVLGLAGLSIIWAAIAVLAVHLQIPKKYRARSYLILLLAGGALFPFEGVRTQIISWLFFSVIVLILRNHYNRHYLLIPLTFAWVNLHGSFPLGIVLYGVYIIAALIKHKLNKSEILVSVFMITATFINPYGHRIWWEVWMQMSDTALRWSIIEWMPAILFINLPLWMYTVVSTTLIFRYRKNFGLFEKASCVLFLLAMIGSYRHAPLWMILSMLPTLKALEMFNEEVNAYQYGRERLGKFTRILLILAAIAGLLHVFLFIKDDIPGRGEKRYPYKAVQFVRHLKPEGEIISVYEWGGYLNWRLPEKRVFIDGRMPSWRWKAPNKKESDYAFPEYRKALYNETKHFEKVKKKYNIGLALLPRPKKPVKNFLDAKFEQLLIKFFAIKDKNENKKRAIDTMKKIYEDDVAVIYQTKSP